MIIKSTTGEVFGAFCSDSWSKRNDKHERMKRQYFGTGATFVFKVIDSKVQTYSWVGVNKMPLTTDYLFMAAPHDGAYSLMVSC